MKNEVISYAGMGPELLLTLLVVCVCTVVADDF